jgi:putative membrane protein
MSEALAGLAAILYLAAARGVPRWPVRRTAAALAGMAVGLVALRIPDEALPAHMAQHAVLTMAAAPLIAVGAPLLLTLRRLPAAPRAALGGMLERVGGSPLGHPVVPWALFVAAQWTFHTGPLLRLAERSAPFHVLEHATLLAVAVLFWMPVLSAGPTLGRLRGGGRCLYLLLAAPATELVAVYLAGSGRPQAAAAMAAAMSPLGLAFAVVTWRWLTAEERRARRWEELCEARGWKAYG